MYFPYLRGKQFELIALREFAAKYPHTSHVTPIIEPVKSTFSSLSKAVEALFEYDLPFALILNPQEGDFRRDSKNILAEVPQLSLPEKSGQWIPAFLYSPTQEDTILSYIQKENLKHVMLVFKDGMEVNDKMLQFLSNPDILYIVNGDPDSRVVMRKLRNLADKKIIRLDNCFIERPRNADYLNIPEEKFTEKHRFYKDDHYYGLSDYTTLPKTFIDGGMLPYAVAIHMTYEKNKDEIYVRHFVSDTNDDQSNIQKKFSEAARKLKVFFTNKPKTPAIDELIQLLDDEKYPGLGVIKKLSIRNHMELMNRILSE